MKSRKFIAGLLLALVAIGPAWAGSMLLLGAGKVGSVTAGPTTTPLMGMLTGAPSTSAANFSPIFGNGAWGGVEANRASIIGLGGTITSIRVHVNAAVATATWSFALRKGGANQFTCVITASAQDCNASGSVSVGLTDIWTWAICPGTWSGNTCSGISAPTALSVVQLSAVFVGTNNNETPLIGHWGGSNPSTSAANWFGFSPTNIAGTSNDANVSNVMPTAGTLDNLICVMSAAPSNTMTISVWKNGAATGLYCTVTGAATSAQSSVQGTNTPVTFVQGDTISWQSCPGTLSGGACSLGSATNAAVISIGARFVPTVGNEAVLFTTSSSANQPPAGASGYGPVGQVNLYNNSTEASTQSLAPAAMHLTKLTTSFAPAVTGTQTRSATLRENSSTPGGANTCTMSVALSTTTGCTDNSTSFSVTLGNLYNILWGVSNTPSNITTAKLSMVAIVP